MSLMTKHPSDDKNKALGNWEEQSKSVFKVFGPGSPNTLRITDSETSLQTLEMNMNPCLQSASPDEFENKVLS